MNTREFAQNLSFVMPDAAIMVSDDSAAPPPTLVHGTRAVQIPTFTVCRGFIIGESGVEATTRHPPLSPADLMHATVDAVLDYTLGIHQKLYDAGVPSLARTVVFVSPNLDPEAVDVGVYVFRTTNTGGMSKSCRAPEISPSLMDPWAQPGAKVQILSTGVTAYIAEVKLWKDHLKAAGSNSNPPNKELPCYLLRDEPDEGGRSLGWFDRSGFSTCPDRA